MVLFAGAVSCMLCLRWEALGCPSPKDIGNLFTPMEITISSAKSGARYLSSLAPWNTWSMVWVTQSQEAEHRSVCIWQHRFDLWWILFGHCRLKVSFMKCSGTEFVRRWKTQKLGNYFPPKLSWSNIRVEIDVSEFLFPAPAFLSLTCADSSNKLVKNKALAFSKSETMHWNLQSLVKPLLGAAWDCQLETGQQKFVESHLRRESQG